MTNDDAEPRLAIDRTTRRPVLMAPQRRHRPLHTQGKANGPCPFCTGEEHQTPPELDAARDAGAAGEPGWRVRAFANLYPAAREHEVVVEGAAHETRPAAVSATDWASALAVYQRRIAAMEALDSVECAFLFKNVGRMAGASIAHNHSQILGLPALPPRLALELDVARADGCALCAELESAEREHRVIVAGQRHIALCASVPKLPNEIYILPTEHDLPFDALDGDARRDLASVMLQLFTALDRTLHDPALNAYLHRVPHEDFHWHFEVQPRTGFLAGLELGGDMYINSISGAESATRLRESLS